MNVQGDLFWGIFIHALKCVLQKKQNKNRILLWDGNNSLDTFFLSVRSFLNILQYSCEQGFSF